MRFLYIHNDEFDQAIRLMMDHSVESFDHLIFIENVTKVMNQDLFYKSIAFYVQEVPSKLLDILHTLQAKLDHEKVARDAKQWGYLPLIKKYLENVQDVNLKTVNESLNNLYIEEEDFAKLRESITSHTAFDQLVLAEKLKNHELLEFRRISSVLYQMNKQYVYAIDLCKGDKLYKDAITIAGQSKDVKICEDLILFFVQNNLKECFAAALYSCYEFIRPDVALEFAWKYKILDMSMPYLVQVLREYTKKVDYLTKKNQELEARQGSGQEDVQQQQFYEQQYSDSYQQPTGGFGGGFPQGGNQGFF